MRISVIIPTFNRAQTVCRAIDSVVNQTFAPIEVIVVDDGSTDNTKQVLSQRYGKTICLLINEHNQGVSAARNVAIHYSTGDWIAFLDSDDEWLPKKLARQIEQLQSCGSIFCHTNEIWIRDGVRVNAMKKHTKQGGNIFHRCVDMCVISPSSAMIKKAALLEYGGFDESLPACEDYDLWLRLTSNIEVSYIDEPLLIKFGGHEDQLSRKYWGMDRFRVHSLSNLLSNGTLNTQQETLVRKSLAKKLAILQKGAIKHRNSELLNYCSELRSKFYD